MNEKKTIGYLGPIGTYTGIAVNYFFPETNAYELREFPNIQACLLAANERKTNYTVVPIENSIGGSVNMTLDWLVHEISVPILGEVRLPIHHELLAHPDRQQNKRADVIYGHPQAIKQCEKFLMKHYAHCDIRPMDSSAEAAKKVAMNPDKPWLAIANSMAKEIYHLTTVRSRIEDNEANRTRFILLGDEPLPLGGTKVKSSLTVSFPENDLLVLHEVLDVFKRRDIKPTKIASAPMKTELGEYMFFIDVETTNRSEQYDRACEDIRNKNCTLRHLGTYPTFDIVETVNS